MQIYKSFKCKNSKTIGTDGESKVLSYLLENNFTIIQKNFRTRYGEIDIIAKSKNGVLRFIEVKTMLGSNIEDQIHSFTNRNLKKYYKLINEYFFLNEINSNQKCYIDLAVVTSDR